MVSLHSLDIVLSVYNQEKLIQRVLYGIFFHTTTPFNLILVFDGCTDKSEVKAKDFIRRFRPKYLKKVIVKHSNNVYETKANNIGFREAREPYAITIQDDMVIREKGWERRLTYPLRKFNDVIAITSEEARDIKLMIRQKEVFDNRASRELGTLPRNIFSIRDIINRGPVAFRTDYFKKLGYFDEAFAPAEYDEPDFCLKAWLKYGWKVGAFWIDYESRSSWGKTRSSDSTMPQLRSRKKSRTMIYERYHEYLSAKKHHSQDIEINDEEIDYVPNPKLPSLINRAVSYCTCHSLDDLYKLLTWYYKFRPI